MKKILLTIFAAVALWGCSKNGGDDPASLIELPFGRESPAFISLSSSSAVNDLGTMVCVIYS